MNYNNVYVVAFILQYVVDGSKSAYLVSLVLNKQ